MLNETTPPKSIKEKLESLLDNVTNNCQGLFSESHRYFKTFEKGTYACAILKPTKRMRANIGASREILLVSSTFEDQQQRTLKFIMSEIENSEGRLETTIAMVVHLDKEGNLKLRNWGREVGLSIIAINGNTQIESNLDFEKRVSAQLYSHDPFDVSGPVSSDSAFFGRRDEAIDLARHLQSGQIRSCLGIRKIGKTSIINRVLLEIGRTYNCICVMVDCSKDEVFDADAEVLLNSIAHSVESALNEEVAYCSVQILSKTVSLMEARNRLEEVIVSSEIPVILVFDEVDYITPGSPTSPHWRKDFNRFWRSLRAVYQECGRAQKILSILVGGVSTYWFTVEKIDGVENAVLAFIPEEYLSPMPTGASIAMLKRLGRVSGLSISEKAAQYISQSTGNIPFWSRKCGSYVHRSIDFDNRPVDVDRELVEPIVEKFIQEEGSAIAEVALTHLFRVHPGTKSAAEAVHAGNASTVSTSMFRTLCRYGVISESGRFSGSMLNSAYSSLRSGDVPSTKSSAEDGSEGGSSLGEWAEDLSVVNRRRNILEKKLRGISLNFLRAEAMQSDKLQTFREDLLAMFPNNRRNVMRNLSADEIMERANWLELTNIFARKWNLFEKIFGDKKRFRENCDIVNDRQDAHAKEFDQADFALYRRALSQLEKSIEKLG